MATSLKEMGQVKLLTTNTAIYTAGAGVTGILTELVITNTDTVARQVGIALVRGGSGFTAFTSPETILVNYSANFTLAPSETKVFHFKTIIATTGVLSGKCDAANVIAVVASGIEKS